MSTETGTLPDVSDVQFEHFDDEDNHLGKCVLVADLPALFAPRVISTPAERAALPAGTVVRSASGTIACRHHDENVGVLFGMSTPFKWSDLSLPLTVLYLPA